MGQPKSILAEFPNLLQYYEIYPGTPANPCGKCIAKARDVIRHYRDGHQDIVHRSAHEVAIVTNNDGYAVVDITIEKKSRSTLLHRLIAEIYIINSDPDKFVEVNHKNGKKQDNQLHNLEWVTHAENQAHASSTGLMGCPVKDVITGTVYKSLEDTANHVGVTTAVMHDWMYKGSHIPSNRFEYVDVELNEQVASARVAYMLAHKMRSATTILPDVPQIFSSMTGCDRFLHTYIGHTQYALETGQSICGQQVVLYVDPTLYLLNPARFQRFKSISIGGIQYAHLLEANKA